MARPIFSVRRSCVQFNALMFVGILHANTMQSFVARERTVFYREKAANMYNPWFMNLAVGVTEIPYVAFNTFIFTNIFYWMVGLKADAGVFFFWYLVFYLWISFQVHVHVPTPVCCAPVYAEDCSCGGGYSRRRLASVCWCPRVTAWSASPSSASVPVIVPAFHFQV